jgi:hypothetical protein
MPKNTFVFLDEDTHAKLKAKADAEGRSVSNYIGRLIESDLKLPLTDKKRGKVKRELEFKEGDIVDIPKSSYSSSKPNMRVKVVAVSKTWALVRNAEYPGSMPFVASMRDLRHIPSTTQPANDDAHEVTA